MGLKSYTQRWPHLNHLKLCALHCTLLSILFKQFAISCRRLLNIRLWFFFFPVAFIVIGVGVYGSKIKDLNHKLGWSFGVTIGGAVLGFVAGIAELIVLLKWEMASLILLEVLSNVCRSLCYWHFRGFFFGGNEKCLAEVNGFIKHTQPPMSVPFCLHLHFISYFKNVLVYCVQIKLNG